MAPPKNAFQEIENRFFSVGLYDGTGTFSPLTRLVLAAPKTMQAPAPPPRDKTQRIGGTAAGTAATSTWRHQRRGRVRATHEIDFRGVYFRACAKSPKNALQKSNFSGAILGAILGVGNFRSFAKSLYYVTFANS